MGGITHTLFGGSSSKSNSGNLALPYVFDNFGPWAGAGTGALGSMASILGSGGLGSAGGNINLANDGIPGDAAANGGTLSLPGGGGGYASGAGGNGLQRYLNSSGYNFMLDSGSKAITNNAAARGLLNSGSTLKALTQYGQDLASTKLDNYLGHLSDIAKISLGAGGLVSDAGQVSNGSGDSETGGLGKFIGAILASDRRLKTNIKRLGNWDSHGDGLGKYSWNWKADPNGPTQIGVIADEVEALRPWAFVPNFKGQYAGVNYSKLSYPANAAEFI